MKAKTLFLLLISLSLFASAQNKQSKLPYSIKGKIEGLQNVDIYLANYYGNKLYYNDTCHVDAKGNYEFAGKPFNECGKYALVMPGPRYFDFIASDEQIIINCSADADLSKIEVVQSKENKLFFEYIRYINGKRNVRMPLDNCINDSLKSEGDKKPCIEELTKLNNEVINYQKDLIKNNSTSLFAKFLRMGMEEDIPNAPSNIAEDKKQEWQYYWYRHHYWDRCDLKDPRMVRDGAFHKLVEDYITKTLPQIPDTVCAEVQKIIKATAGNEESFKYITHFATYTGETSKIMCMDELFVFMIDNYYSKGMCNWVKEDKLKEMKEAADKKRDCRCGEKAPDIILPDTSEKNWVSMYKSRGEYTLMVVWESSCGHCKKEVPLLLDLYHKYKDKGFVVYAIGNDYENNKWVDFINEHKLDWINVSDTPEIMKQEKATELIYSGVTTLKSLNYRTTWDVTSTPKVFLMDKDMKIIAKSLGAEQLDQLLENLYKGEKVETNKFQETEYEDVNAPSKPINKLSQEQIEENQIKENLENLIIELSASQNITNNVQTNITAELIEEKDADGNNHINLHIDFYYEVAKLNVESKTDDFPAGGYLLEESKAAMLTAAFIKKSLEEKLTKYLQNSRRVSIIITGSTDATPITSKIKYLGEYGAFKNEITIINGQANNISIEKNSLINSNEKLAFLRACGIKQYLNQNVQLLNNTANDYEIRAIVSPNVGNQYRRIAVEVIVHDAYESKNANSSKQNSLSQMYLENKKAVFTIYTGNANEKFQGSGFFISKSGIGVSNYHVFENTKFGIVKLDNGEIYKISEIIEENKDLDYIIFKVDLPKNYSNDIVDISFLSNNVGDPVFAIGSPQGYEQTLSEGIISGFRFDNKIIQTTTPINHGSSGGPLFNMKGEVIGITSGSLEENGFGDGSLFGAINIKLLQLERFK